MRPLNPGSTVAASQQVASSTSAVTLLSANPNRIGATIFNDSTAILHVKFGSGASATDKALEIAAGGYLEVPFHYVGVITGAWETANGNAYVTEFS